MSTNNSFSQTEKIGCYFSSKNLKDNKCQTTLLFPNPLVTLYISVAISCAVPQGAQYIGEICRYLLSVPESPEERNHEVEIMWGNGLRPQIWQQFVNRSIRFI